MTDTAQSSSFIEADAFGVRQRSLLTRDGVILPGSGYTVLVPAISFASGIPQSIQDRGDFIVTVTNRHAANDV